jgi:hypothetical protein
MAARTQEKQGERGKERKARVGPRRRRRVRAGEGRRVVAARVGRGRLLGLGGPIRPARVRFRFFLFFYFLLKFRNTYLNNHKIRKNQTKIIYK